MPLNSTGWNIIFSARILVIQPTNAAPNGIVMYTHSG